MGKWYLAEHLSGTVSYVVGGKMTKDIWNELGQAPQTVDTQPPGRMDSFNEGTFVC